MSHPEEGSAVPLDETGKPDFMVWPPIPDAPRFPRATPPPPPARRRRPLLLKLLVATVVVGLLVVVGGVGAFFIYQRDLNKNIGRIGNPFVALPEKTRPKAAPDGATNILLLGSDNKISSAPGDWARGAQTTDAIMVAHIPASRSHVTVTSIPRDSWVTIPGHGANRLNAGFKLGGPSLMVATVENLTGVRIDHVVILDFAGFKDITDELGGVTVNVPQSTAAEETSFSAGPQVMDGATALNYVRQRADLPGGDLGRVRRQQNWLRAVTLKTLDKGTLTSPRRLSSVLGSLTSSIAADDGFTIGRMRSLAVSLHGVRGNDLTFLTAPVLPAKATAKSAKTTGGTAVSAATTGHPASRKQPVVHLDLTANRALWASIANDTVNSWLAEHPDAALGSSVR